MAPASITNIPLELLLSIIEKLPRQRKDAFALRQVCRLLSVALGPVCLSTAVVKTAPKDIDSLKALALATEQRHPVNTWARKLVIKTCNHEEFEEPEALVRVETVIRNLRNITYLEWLEGGTNFSNIAISERIPILLVGALERLAPSLRKVEIQSIRAIHIPLINWLSQLTHLTLLDNSSARYRDFNESYKVDPHTYSSICGAISRSSQTLEGLKLYIPRWEHSSSLLHDLLEKTHFPHFPELTSLSLEVPCAPLEMVFTCTLPSLKPHFSSLRALHLLSRMSDIPTQMPSDNDNLFTILKRSGIHLTEIKSGGICKPLLQYLLSYRNTVQQLTLNVSLSTANQRLAEDLDKVLLNHQSSLRELSISAPLDEGWALGENNKDMLLVSLPVLQSLKIPVFMDSGGSLGGEDYLKLCLDRVVDRTRFPLLRWLHIDCMVDKIPKYSGFRTPPRCGAGAFVNRQRRYAEALRRLQSYRFNIDNSGARGGAMAQLPLLNICNLDAHSTYCEGVGRYEVPLPETNGMVLVGGLGLGGQRRSRR